MWLEIKSPALYSPPAFCNFKEDKIYSYKLSEYAQNGIYTLIKQNYLLQPPLETEWIHNNRIRLTTLGKKSSITADGTTIITDKLFKNDYQRLLPTITSLKDEEIQYLKFLINYYNTEIEIIFNTFLKETPAVEYVNNRLGKKGREIKLQRVDRTLFLSFYEDQVLEKVIPIEKIDRNIISVYGLPSEPYAVNGYAI